jgi:hypothetical protein
VSRHIPVLRLKVHMQGSGLSFRNDFENHCAHCLEAAGWMTIVKEENVSSLSRPMNVTFPIGLGRRHRDISVCNQDIWRMPRIILGTISERGAVPLTVLQRLVIEIPRCWPPNRLVSCSRPFFTSWFLQVLFQLGPSRPGRGSAYVLAQVSTGYHKGRTVSPASKAGGRSYIAFSWRSDAPRCTQDGQKRSANAARTGSIRAGMAGSLLSRI